MNIKAKIADFLGINKTPDYSSLYDLGDFGVGGDVFNGEKFFGGFGSTKFFVKDYYELRAKSNQIFTENLYAMGIINRLVTNEIHKGLSLEAMPVESVLGVQEGSLTAWTDEVEERFKLWGNNARVCDVEEMRNFGEIQTIIRTESLVSGDVLVIYVIDAETGLPKIQLIDGNRVCTPLDTSNIPKKHKIKYGVEIDERGRHIAYHVQDADDHMKSTRVLARGEKSGRLSAKLVYGTTKRIGETRGTPLLGIMVQSIKEIDRYRDSTLRKAVISSVFVLSVEKDRELHGTRPITNAAARNGQAVTVNPATATQRRFNVSDMLPGTIVEELQAGETLKPYPNTGTDINFKEFEMAILRSIAWASQIPPEILVLEFGSNYSASQAATNEFRLYLTKARADFSAQVNQPTYELWLQTSALQNDIRMPKFVESFGNKRLHYIWSAWTNAMWMGVVKPNADLFKTVRTYEKAIQNGLMSRDQASTELNGSNFRKNVKRLMNENKELAEVNKIFEKEPANG